MNHFAVRRASVAASTTVAGLVSGALLTAAIAPGASAVASTTSAAPAASRTAHDARGDMHGHGADIHSVRVVNEKAVRVVVHHQDLVRSYTSNAGIKVYLDTDRDARGPEYVFMGGIFEGADYALQTAEHWKATGVVPLQDRYRMRLDYRDEITRIRLSRKALGHPDAVRVTVRTGGDLDGRRVTDWLHGVRHFTRWVPQA
ncbi:MAG TPA: hypothetical protein VFM50_05440 [Nocardioidaceae bacterium]|jgi:hypothetical protein|nr:hypothetical protein [Nocardioidaceae bacterium]